MNRDKKNRVHDLSNQYFVRRLLNNPDKEAVLSTLSNAATLSSLRQTLSSAFSIAVGSDRRMVSFQQLAVTLCQLLTHPQILSSVQEVKLTKIYKLVTEPSNPFIEQYSCCMYQIANRKCDVSDHSISKASPELLVVPSFYFVLYPFLLLLKSCLEFPEFSIPPEVILIIKESHKSCLRHTQLSKLQSKRLKKLMDQVTPSKVSDDDIDKLDFSEDDDGPGSLSYLGPRHDNDAEQFRRINIFPTPSEILSIRAPYLPYLKEGASGSALGETNVVDAHLGAHFRVLREDMTRKFRLAVRQFLQRLFLGEHKPNDISFDIKRDGKVEGLCYTWPKVEVRDFTSDPATGPAFQLHLPQLFPLSSREERSSKWDSGHGAKLLQVGSLVCLIFHVQDDYESSSSTSINSEYDDKKDMEEEEFLNSFADSFGENSLVLAKVVRDHREQLPETSVSCAIDISPISKDCIPKLISELDCINIGTDKASTRTSVTMLQLMGHFITGTETVLESLRKMDATNVPFSESIISVPRNLEESEKNISRLSRNSSSTVDISSPAYFDGSTTYDLSFLATNNEAAETLCSVPVHDVKKTMKLFLELESHVSLNKSQIEAFVFGICKEFSVIQGPPGTGKTWTSVQIVGAILKNQHGLSHRIKENENIHNDDRWKKVGRKNDFRSEEMFEKKSLPKPILCVCFTNHALDQFLEALVDRSVVNIGEIVRIGSRSTSELIKTRVLSKVIQHDRSGNNAEFFSCRRNFYSISTVAEGLAASLMGKGENLFATWLQEHEPNLFQNIEEDHLQSDDLEFCHGAFSESQVESSSTDPERRDRRNKLEVARQRFKQHIREKISQTYSQLQFAFEKLKDARLISKVRALKNVRVIGCTTSGAALNRKLLHAVGPAVIIGEEAAEACEGHLLSSFSPHTEHVVLVGDHEQLRPRIAEYNFSFDSGKGYNLDISLFERLARERNVPIVRLSEQRRMHPKIADLARLSIYPFLSDSDFVKQYDEFPIGFKNPLFFWSHNHLESENNDVVGRNQSHFNIGEIEMITKLTRYVIKQGYEEHQIAILTPYVAQLKLIHQRFEEQDVSVSVSDPNIDDLNIANLPIISIADEKTENSGDEIEAVGSRSMNECVRLSTVDKFQGEEADIVLISLVRSNEEGNLGFLKSSNRVNVMLTRARKGMIIIGSGDTVNASGTSGSTFIYEAFTHMRTIEKVVGTALPLQCKKHKRQSFVTPGEEFPDDGGCSEQCDYVLPCGHGCGRLCHPDDEKHTMGRCQAPCEKKLEICGHKCPRQCAEPCGGCDFPIDVNANCGHIVHTTCGLAGTKDGVKCDFITEEAYSTKCGHIVAIHCWENGTQLRACDNLCGEKRQCGHQCHLQCGHAIVVSSCVSAAEKPELIINNGHNGQCGQICSRIMLCQHVCSEKCHEGLSCPNCMERCTFQCRHVQCEKSCNEVCVPCTARCDWECSCEMENSERCDLECAAPCTRIPCNNRCRKVLKCGHQCTSLCGEDCPSEEYCVICKTNGNENNALEAHSDDFDKNDEVEGNWKCDPTIFLKCKHLMSVRQLDEQFKMELFYKRSENGIWNEVCDVNDVLSSQNNVKHIETCNPKCIVCDAPIVGVRRYHRILMLKHLYRLSIQWNQTFNEEAHYLSRNQNRLNDVMWKVTELRKRRHRHQNDIDDEINNVRDIFNRARNILDKIQYLKSTHGKEHPMNRCGNGDEVSLFVAKTTLNLKIMMKELEISALFMRANACCMLAVLTSQRENSVRDESHMNEIERNIEQCQRLFWNVYNDKSVKKKKGSLRADYGQKLESIKSEVGVFIALTDNCNAFKKGKEMQSVFEDEVRKLIASEG